MAISINSLLADSDLSDASSYVSASIAPSANRLLLVAVVGFNVTGSNAPTMTGLGLTWTQIASVATLADPFQTTRITLFGAYTGAGVSPGTLTFDFGGQTQLRCLRSVCEVSGSRQSEIQSATNAVVDSSITVTLAAFADAVNNAAFGVFSSLAISNQVYNVGAGFTQLSLVETSQSEPFNYTIPLLTEWKTGEDTSVDASGDASFGRIGIAIEIEAEVAVERYIKMDAELQALAERFIKLNAHLSYPERYVKLGPVLEAIRERFLKMTAHLSYPERFVKLGPVLEALRWPYIKLNTQLQATAARYIKSHPVLQQVAETYIKLNAVFAVYERYLKIAASLTANTESFVRLKVSFTPLPERYIKLQATLVKNPPLEDLGDTPPPAATGLLSRQYMNLASVKKEV